jgi:tetratricopeptide (TPR) repeat protein
MSNCSYLTRPCPGSDAPSARRTDVPTGQPRGSAAALSTRVADLTRSEANSPSNTRKRCLGWAQSRSASSAGTTRETSTSVRGRIAESVAPESREAGQAYLGLGTVALETDQLQEAEQWLLKAAQNPNLEPSEQIQAATSWDALRSDAAIIKSAHERFTRALERQRALPDTPLNIARTLYNLGVSALERGEVAQAREFCRQALEIRQREAPQSVAVAHTLVALGFTEFYSRDFVQARRYFEQALAAYNAANAEPLERSRALMGLGFAATELGAFEEAETYLRDALQTLLKHNARQTALHAQTLVGLGNLALRRGELDAASRHYTLAHAIASELPTTPLLKAQSLTGLGNLALRQRDLPRAESYYAQAQQVLDQFAPESPLAVQIRLNLGALALELGDAERAAAIFTNARAAAERLAQAELLARVNLSAAIAAIRAGRHRGSTRAAPAGRRRPPATRRQPAAAGARALLSRRRVHACGSGRLRTQRF